jgi:hypothetical protein
MIMSIKTPRQVPTNAVETILSMKVDLASKYVSVHPVSNEYEKAVKPMYLNIIYRTSWVIPRHNPTIDRIKNV